MTNDVHHIAVFVRDMDRALHLFEDLLGFEVVWRDPQLDLSKLFAMLGSPITEAEFAYLQGRTDGAALELICPTQPVIDDDVVPFGGRGSCQLSVAVEDLDGCCQRLNEEGWPLLTPVMPITTPGGDSKRICFFRTEDGLTIELVAS